MGEGKAGARSLGTESHRLIRRQEATVAQVGVLWLRSFHWLARRQRAKVAWSGALWFLGLTGYGKRRGRSWCAESDRLIRTQEARFAQDGVWWLRFHLVPRSSKVLTSMMCSCLPKPSKQPLPTSVRTEIRIIRNNGGEKRKPMSALGTKYRIREKIRKSRRSDSERRYSVSVSLVSYLCPFGQASACREAEEFYNPCLFSSVC